MSNKGKSEEPSALSNIVNAGASGMASPSEAAQIAGAFAPPGAEEAAAQGLQATVNMAIAGSRELMAGTIRQHGRGPSAVLQDMKIQLALNAQSANNYVPNKGIESFRQRASGSPTEQSSRSPDKGPSKSSGQGR